MEFKKTSSEFILLPIFTIDNWYMPELHMIQRVYTIGWLKWFVRWNGRIVGYDYETQGYEDNF